MKMKDVTWRCDGEVMPVHQLLADATEVASWVDQYVGVQVVGSTQ